MAAIFESNIPDQWMNQRPIGESYELDQREKVTSSLKSSNPPFSNSGERKRAKIRPRLNKLGFFPGDLVR